MFYGDIVRQTEALAQNVPLAEYPIKELASRTVPISLYGNNGQMVVHNSEQQGVIKIFGQQAEKPVLDVLLQRVEDDDWTPGLRITAQPAVVGLPDLTDKEQPTAAQIADQLVQDPDEYVCKFGYTCGYVLDKLHWKPNKSDMSVESASTDLGSDAALLVEDNITSQVASATEASVTYPTIYGWGNAPQEGPFAVIFKRRSNLRRDLTGKILQHTGVAAIAVETEISRLEVILDSQGMVGRSVETYRDRPFYSQLSPHARSATTAIAPAIGSEGHVAADGPYRLQKLLPNVIASTLTLSPEKFLEMSRVE